MNRLLTLLVLVAVVLSAPGCGSKGNDKDRKKDEGAVDSTVDYLTGNTAVQAKFRAQRTLTKVTIKESIDRFQIENGRLPISLKELVGAGYLDKQFLNDEFGKPLEVEATQDHIAVRSVRIDTKTGKRTVNWEETFK
jgi:hypothetical protein